MLSLTNIVVHELKPLNDECIDFVKDILIDVLHFILVIFNVKERLID